MAEQIPDPVFTVTVYRDGTFTINSTKGAASDVAASLRILADAIDEGGTNLIKIQN